MKILNQNRSTSHFRQLLAFLLVFSVLHMNIPLSAAVPAKVPVSVADFPIRLNGVLLRQQKDAYFPILVYRGISYLPMTQSHSELLNLMTHWIEEKSMLSISSPWSITLSYTDPSFNAADDMPNKNLSAQPVWYPISINGQLLDLNNQPYPILNFRNITYLPLTWHIAVELLGLNYRFTAENGLDIRSSGYEGHWEEEKPQNLLEQIPALNPAPSSLPPLKEMQSIVLPKNAFADPIVYKNGLLFYFVTQGQSSQNGSVDFWRRPLNGSAEKIGSVKVPGQSNGFHYPWLLANNDLLFTSHFGGAIMGTEWQYFLPDSGSSRLICQRRFEWLLPYQGEWLGRLFSVAGPQPGLILMNQQGEIKTMGLPDKYYSIGDGNKKYCIQGDYLYASVQDKDGSGLYQINLKTNHHKKLTAAVEQFFTDKDAIYYTTADQKASLRRLNLITGQNEVFVELPVGFSSISVADGTCIWALPIAGTSSYSFCRSRGGKWEHLSTDAGKWQRSDKYFVYHTLYQGKPYIIVCDRSGIAYAAFRSDNKDIDFALNGDELIIWSWQDQTVRYFKL